MFLREHPFPFLRHLFRVPVIEQKEPPDWGALFVFSSRGESRQDQEVRRADAHLREGGAGLSLLGL